ncbi:hypothetical protein GCM10008904_10380 [Paraclostridium ghonii]|uniref:DUF4830 domain-containing protein n=1 Tax=Paraclostridium ghonii TaxID=29358 RepID=A0ABU0MYD5_9FIRM|nr:hypothetical protein [Paeniclostridium ghonii]MDQ0555933.1 hypothetical protein [Paeniclostridium ghonii]
MIKNIKKLTLLIVVLFIFVVGYTVYRFDFNSLNDQDSPVIADNDSFSNAQKILEDYGYNLKDVQETEKTQSNMPDLKRYTYEGKNGIISILTNGEFIYDITYYE